MSFFGDVDELKTEAKSFEPIPKGEYTVQVSDCAVDENGKYWVDNQERTGPVAMLEYTLSEGTYANRKVWMNYALELYAKRKSLGTQLLRVGLDVESAADVNGVAKLLVEGLQGKYIKLGVTTWLNPRTDKTKNFGFINDVAEKPGVTQVHDSLTPKFDKDEAMPF